MKLLKIVYRKTRILYDLWKKSGKSGVRNIISYKIGMLEWKKYESAFIRNNFRGRYVFINRSKNADNLLIVVAGYQEYLWDSIFERIACFCPRDYDVCIVVPGEGNGDIKKIKSYCRDNSWSFIQTKKNKLAFAQNIAVREHKNAQWIFKLDEDIFIGNGYFDGLKEAYEYTKSETEYSPGIVVPVLNVNGVTSLDFIKMINAYETWVELFGENARKRSAISSPAWNSPEAAVWIWKNTFPLDEKIKNMKSNARIYSLCPMRFSIGAFLIERSYWNEMHGFAVAREGILGVEEDLLFRYSMSRCRVIVIANRVLAGHFAFGGQKERMYQFYNENKNDFVIHEKNYY